ncbi:hypothetical protein P7K49_033148 [Saguinus oedipus]|uniref:Uncharacterized protein n=1 Tax=Saguinus oedipus TaxID=9490 RepID=A0ABQ9TR39_SAGOE|nr:hypothetical protein P7K49_033148 [Saguinus oedipus]
MPPTQSLSTGSSSSSSLSFGPTAPAGPALAPGPVPPTGPVVSDHAPYAGSALSPDHSPNTGHNFFRLTPSAGHTFPDDVP